MRVNLISLLFLVACGGVNASSEAYEWLDKMNNSVRNLDYEGHFVYQTGNQLGSMYLVHRINDGVELERLVALNGEPRQVIRGNHAVACLQPGKKDIHVTGNAFGRSLTPQGEVDHRLLGKHYALSVGEQQRVAGRLAILIRIEPKDTLRFGYQLFLDQESALPLRSVVLDAAGEQRSQLLFVDLKTGSDVTPIENDISALQRTQIGDFPSVKHNQPPGLANTPAWHFESLPAGYTLRSYRQSPDGNRDHFVFSDGLASVSVYVESIEGEGLEGFSRMGAVQALGIQHNHHQITVVGEVPKATLHLLATAIKPAR